jgi:hypothetical protein
LGVTTQITPSSASGDGVHQLAYEIAVVVVQLLHILIVSDVRLLGRAGTARRRPQGDPYPAREAETR